VVNGAFTKTLSGYQVLFNGIAAPLLYAGPNQINVVSPAAMAGQRTADIVVQGPGGSTVFPEVFVAAARPVIFSTPVIYLDAVSQELKVSNVAVALNPDGTINSPTNPAPNGSSVTIWATGTGILSATQPDGAIVPQSAYPATQVPITVVDKSSTSRYLGQAPEAVLGLTQINIVLGTYYGTYGIQLQQGDALSSVANFYSQ